MNRSGSRIFVVVLLIVAAAGLGIVFTTGSGQSTPTESASAGFFSADTTVIPAGGCVKLAWHFENAVLLILRGSNWHDGRSEAVEPDGSTTVCPSAALDYVPDKPVDYTLTVTFANQEVRVETVTITYETGGSLNQNVTAPLPTSVFPTQDPALPVPQPTTTPAAFTPSAPPLETPIPAPDHMIAFYQEFEHGFMLQRLGEACVYGFVTDIQDNSAGLNGAIIMIPPDQPDASSAYRYCTPFADIPQQTTGSPPASALLEANTPFALVYGHYAEFSGALGEPLTGKVMYTPPLPPRPQVIMGGVFYTPIIYLPDGRLFECGTRSATAATCQIG